jgi:hypothetical protein
MGDIEELTNQMTRNAARREVGPSRDFNHAIDFSSFFLKGRAGDRYFEGTVSMQTRILGTLVLYLLSKA